MTPSLRRLGVWLVLLLVICAVSRTAVAAPAVHDTIRLSLTTADGLPPTHVCVITEGVDNGLVPQQSQRLERLERLLCALGSDCRRFQWDDLESVYFSVGRQTEGQTAISAGQGEAPLGADSQLLRGLRGVSRQYGEHQCVYSRTIGCVPTFSLRGFKKPREAYITCAENRARTSAAARVDDGVAASRGLLLGLSANASAPLDHVQIRDLQLSGGHLLIRTSHNVDNVDLVVRSLGGFYTPEPEAQFTRGRVEAELAIEPRCLMTRVGIPPITSTASSSFRYKLRLELASQRTAREGREEERRRYAQHQKQHPDIVLAPPPDEPTDESSAPDRCMSGSLQGTELQVLLPYQPGEMKILSIHSDDRDPATDEPLWEIDARWLGARPIRGQTGDATPRQLAMSVRSLSFAWRADDCLYPQGECPAANIATSGQTCTRRNPTIDGGLCHYRCAANDGASVDFPTRIGFSRGATPPPGTPTPASAAYLKWSVPIHAIDEQLGGYVEPEERTFTIDTEPWRSPYPGRKRFPCDLYFGKERRARCEKERAGFAAKRAQERAEAATGASPASAEALRSRELRELREAVCPGRPRKDDLFAVEFATGERERRRVEIDSMLRCDLSDAEIEEQSVPPPALVVKLPRVSCHEPIGYRFVGARSYDAGTREVASGAIQLPHPMTDARYLYFSIAVLPASFQWTLHPDELQRRRAGLLFAPAIEGSLVFRPRGPAVRGWRFNTDVTFIGAPRPYLAVSARPDVSDPDPQRTLYARWYFGFSFLSPWFVQRQRIHYVGPAVALGAGVQVGLGYPILRHDLDRFGGIAGGLVALRGDLRVRLWRFIEATFSPRLLLADEALRYRTDFHGQPDVLRTRAMVSLLLPVGLAFVW